MQKKNNISLYMKDITLYSDPKQVQSRAYQLLGKDAVINLSTRKDKKYMIKDPNGKWIHFGQYGMEDFTKHKDLTRREAFKTRNARWKKATTYSPAWLSYFLTW
jgi:hypothetical protein